MNYSLPLVLPILCSPLVSAQETRLLAADTAAYDELGYTVALGDGLALVGAPYDSDLGPFSYTGSAYFFDANPVSPTYGQQLLKLTSSTQGTGDRFGRSVALGNGLALLAKDGDDSVSVFNAIPTSPAFGSELTILTVTGWNHFDWFGTDVAIDGELALIGGLGDDASGNPTGCAHLFNVNPSSPSFGQDILKLTASDGQDYDYFGWRVSLDGGLALIGAPMDDDLGSTSGSAYIFDANPSSATFGQELIKLTASNGSTSDEFGSSVSLEGGLALIGAQYGDGSGNRTGVAYLFDANLTSPTFGQELAKLEATGGAYDDRFGCDVTLDGKQALVGAYGVDGSMSFSGSAYYFDVDTTSASFGTQLTQVLPADGTSTWFGYCVDLEGGLALVGENKDSDLFSSAGSAYLFGLPCGIDHVCVTSPNSVGLGASLSATGSTSVAANDLVLLARSLPANQFGIIFYGRDPVQIPFGNGIRCIGGGQLFRFSPIQSSSGGLVNWPLDVTTPPFAAGQITPHSTWHFQFWYRDPLAGGANFNLSDALRITFCP
ncbi:MAG TPA: FG-GAP repeat protein [Planctomycetota bacterium]|jgi:hypothetical protein|nr:FG-GAP repeat protein [Planctomycetota bacterium]